MSVIISNVSEHNDLEGENAYTIRFNDDPVLATFSHIRKEGLAALLRRAADAISPASSGEVTGVKELPPAIEPLLWEAGAHWLKVSFKDNHDMNAAEAIFRTALTSGGAVDREAGR